MDHLLMIMFLYRADPRNMPFQAGGTTEVRIYLNIGKLLRIVTLAITAGV